MKMRNAVAEEPKKTGEVDANSRPSGRTIDLTLVEKIAEEERKRGWAKI